MTSCQAAGQHRPVRSKLKAVQMTVKGKGGRPKKKIDFGQLDKLCHIHCTGEECAAILGMDYDTLNRRLKEEVGKGFAEYFAEKSATGKASLRRRQIQSAMEGNPTMLIWLGKQMLKQQDLSKQEIVADISTTDKNKLLERLRGDLTDDEAAQIYQQLMGIN